MKEKNIGTRTTETVTISCAEYEELKSQNEWLMEQLRLLKKKQFGASSERERPKNCVTAQSGVNRAKI